MLIISVWPSQLGKTSPNTHIYPLGLTKGQHPERLPGRRPRVRGQDYTSLRPSILLLSYGSLDPQGYLLKSSHGVPPLQRAPISLQGLLGSQLTYFYSRYYKTTILPQQLHQSASVISAIPYQLEDISIPHLYRSCFLR